MGHKGSKTTTKSSKKKTTGIPKLHSVTTGQAKNPSASDIARFRTIENFVVIWLDSKISEPNQDTRNSITHLRRIVNSIQTFSDSDQCINYLTEIKDEKVFVIVSRSLGQHIIPRISEMTQLASIYIFSRNKPKNEQWTRKYRKVNGVFIRIEPLCDVLKGDVRQNENALTPISIVSSSSTTDLNELDQSFMYSQLLKEILLENEYNDKEKKELIDFCRVHYAENDEQLKVIDEFEQDYPRPSPVWWYTRECFIYQMLNKALRTQDVEIIIKMGFLIRDLHENIERIHSEKKSRQTLTVFRGQGMKNSEFDKMKKSKGCLLSFNNFLSTSIDRAVSLDFARRAREDRDLTAIVFQIEIDASMSTTPFASLDKISYFGDNEKEILFSMHTIFRIDQIKQIEDRLFEVNLTLTSDNDQQLTLLTQHIREETQGPTGLHRMAILMIKMGEFDKSEEIYTTLLETTSADNREELAFLHHELGFILKHKGDLPRALSHYQKSLGVELTYRSSDDPRLSVTYSNIGLVLHDQDDLDGALKYFERALKIDLQAPQPDQPDIATIHNSIGGVLKDQGKYDEALKSYERALTIFLVHLPPRHPSLASSYNNIGLVHRKMGDNSRALSYYEKTLDIRQKSLPPNHPLLAQIYNNMAYVLNDLHRTQEAIDHTERAVEIARHSLSPNHAQMQKYQQHLDELRRKV